MLFVVLHGDLLPQSFLWRYMGIAAPNAFCGAACGLRPHAAPQKIYHPLWGREIASREEKRPLQS